MPFYSDTWLPSAPPVPREGVAAPISKVSPDLKSSETRNGRVFRRPHIYEPVRSVRQNGLNSVGTTVRDNAISFHSWNMAPATIHSNRNPWEIIKGVRQSQKIIDIEAHGIARAWMQRMSAQMEVLP